MKSFLISLVLSLTFSTLHAQNRPASGSIGISASLQSTQTNLEIPIWATENIVIAPVFGLDHEFDSNTMLNFGVNPRFYQDLGDNFASYVGGGEFFPDEHFSLGAEGQLNYLLNDGGNDTISTAAALTGTFYF